MPQLVGSLWIGDDVNVANWVAERAQTRGEQGFGPCTAIGVIRRDKFVGGVVFHSYIGHLVEMSAAFEDPRWCLPGTLRGLFDYPFNQLKVAVMITITGRKNKAARRIDRGLGFKEVGIVPKGYDGQEDAVIYAMARDECRWLKDKSDGR